MVYWRRYRIKNLLRWLDPPVKPWDDKFPMSDVDEIKQKLDIVNVVQDFLPLKKAGSSLRANCPFHQEKTPSFYVSEVRQTFRCFGCNEGGDMFDFVMRIEGLDFPGALRLLAKKAGVELKRENAAISDEKDRLAAINEIAAKFFHEILLRSSAAEYARAYVGRRALATQTVDEFMIGYAPDTWDTLLEFLHKRGFHDPDIVKAGLAAKKDGGGFYDRFRNRLMFPIRDAFGHVIAFTGRIMPGADGKDPDGTAKYVNSPETLIYRKGSVLFAYDAAKRAIKDAAFAVIVEGNMDAIASHQAGVLNVVASSGTALTEMQLSLLKRHAKRLVLSFDRDPAGEAAARRGIDVAVRAGFGVRVLVLPPNAGKDPDDCIRKDPTLWKKAIADAVPFMEWYIALAQERTDFADPDAKCDAADTLMREVAKIPDPVEEAHWVGRLSAMFFTPETLLYEKLAALKRMAPARPRQESAAGHAPATPAPKPHAKADSREELMTEAVIGMLAAWPQLVELVADILPPDLATAAPPDLYTDEQRRYTPLDYGVLSPHDAMAAGSGPDKASTIFDMLAHRAERDFGDFDEPKRLASLRAFIGELKFLRAKRRQRELMAAMSDAERIGDAVAINRIAEELQALIGAERIPRPLR